MGVGAKNPEFHNTDTPYVHHATSVERNVYNGYVLKKSVLGVAHLRNILTEEPVNDPNRNKK